MARLCCSGVERAVPTAGARAARRAAPPRRRLSPARRPHRRGSSISSPSRTRPWSPTPRSTTARCSADHAGSWNLRDRHMADTLDQLLRPTWTATSDARESSSGRTTRTSATLARPRWGRRGELNLGQLMRERHGRDAVQRRLYHLRPAPSPPPRSGTAPPSASASGPRCPAVTRRSFHATHIPPFLLCPLADGASGRALREPRLAPRDRCHLPAADRTPEPLVRRSSLASSSTRSCTSISPARSSRSSARLAGNSGSRPRRTRRRCEQPSMRPMARR